LARARARTWSAVPSRESSSTKIASHAISGQSRRQQRNEWLDIVSLVQRRDYYRQSWRRSQKNVVRHAITIKNSHVFYSRALHHALPYATELGGMSEFEWIF
jgi:hypothetical protein